MQEDDGWDWLRRFWTAEKRAVFFQTLAFTSNVRQSAKAAGVDPQRAYDLRLVDADFAEKWHAARATGYLQVEERLILEARGEPTGEESGDGTRRPMSQSDRELALNLLKFHHGAVGRPHAGGTPPRRTSEAETDAAILKHLAAVKRRMEQRDANDRG
jgi:hypothetical protein